MSKTEQARPLTEVLYGICLSPGSIYDYTRSVWHQDLKGHTQYMLELLRKDILVMAGPFEGSGGQLIIKAESEDRAREIAGNDPAFRKGIFKMTVTRWYILFRAVELK